MSDAANFAEYFAKALDATRSVVELKEAIAKLLAVLDRHDIPESLASAQIRSDIANEIRRTKYAVQVVEIREGESA